MHEWSKLTDPEVDALDRTLPVILPIGLIEAHGGHLEKRIRCLCGRLLRPPHL